MAASKKRPKRGQQVRSNPAVIMKEEWMEAARQALGEGPKFIQAFGQGCDERLMIPHDFLKNIIHEKLVSADIWGPLGQWHVKVECIMSSYYFTEGWPDFVLHHGLQTGYFLVFCHEGFMNFSVLVLDENFCQKFYGTLADKVKDPQVIDDNVNDSDENESHIVSKCQMLDLYPSEVSVTFRTTIRPCNLAKKYFLYIPVYFKEAIGISDEETDLLLRDENQELWLVEVKRSTQNRTMLIRGWKDFCFSHNLKLGSVCQFHPTTECILGIKVVQVQIFEQPEGYSSEMVTETPRTCGTDLDSRRFWVTLSSYSFNDYLIQIPNAFSAAMGMSDMREVILLDQKGELFYVELMHTTRNRIFFTCTGWREFCLAKDLKPGDVCKFEADFNFKENCLLRLVTPENCAESGGASNVKS